MSPLNVLVVAATEDIARGVTSIVAEEGDQPRLSTTVAGALEEAALQAPDVAFVDISVEQGAALALCHLLGTVCPSVEVHAIVHPSDLARGAEALSLGASGMLLAPPNGDAVARALTSRKEDVARGEEIALLQQRLATEHRRLEIYDRLVRFARGAAPSDAVRAIIDGVSQLSAAEGVALYATFGHEETERVLLGCSGSALDFPAQTFPADLSRLVQARQARVVPLVAATGELGLLVLDRAPVTPETEIGQLADLAAAMLAVVDRQDHADEALKVQPPRQFRAIAERILSLAERHGRRASILAITLPGDRPGRREDAAREISDVLRASDALSGSEDGDLLVFLPETTGLGAHACRRRILARLLGDRRSRPRSGSQRAQEARSRPSPIAIGVATFPHDGTALKRLVKTARARARDDARSPVHALALDGMPLAELVDSLVARPMFDAGPRSPYPLDIACPALYSLVARACKDAFRGGEATVTTTLQQGLGVAAAARQVTTPHVIDVRAEPACENLEAIVVEAEHGTWVCCGRVHGDRFRGVHAADPLLADVLGARISSLGGPRAD